MTVIYFADGARVSEPDSVYQQFDLATWLPGMQPGDLAASEINPAAVADGLTSRCSSIGSMSVTVRPPPALVADAVPRWPSAIMRTMASPRPAPGRSRRSGGSCPSIRSKRRRRRGSAKPSGNPGPSSVNRDRHARRIRPPRSTIRRAPRSRNALSSRLSIAWRIRRGSTRTIVWRGDVDRDRGLRGACPRRARPTRRADRRSDVSSRSIGRCPSSARASRRRSSAIRTRRSVSSDALSITAASSAAVRGRDRARSSSALSAVSGVRSSWLALSRKRRSARAASSIRSSISLSVRAKRASLVVGVRHLESLLTTGGGDRRRLPAHALDGPRSATPATIHPATACERERDGTADQEEAFDHVQRVGPVGQGGADDHDVRRRALDDRHGEEPCAVDATPGTAAFEEDGVVDRARSRRPRAAAARSRCSPRSPFRSARGPARTPRAIRRARGSGWRGAAGRAGRPRSVAARSAGPVSISSSNTDAIANIQQTIRSRRGSTTIAAANPAVSRALTGRRRKPIIVESVSSRRERSRATLGRTGDRSCRGGTRCRR